MTISIQDICQHANRMERAERARRYRAISGEHMIVLFAIGETYEAYDESAEALHAICNTPTTHSGNIATADIKKAEASWVIPRLIRAGKRVTIVDNEQ